MRSIIITCGAALACLATPASAQYYRAQQTYTPPPSYERGDWEADCLDYLRDRDRRGDRGAVVGGLVGGVGGALIGNEVAGDGSRLAGTLIGGGVGTLAGAAAGRSIARGGDDGYWQDCEAWYDSRYGGGSWQSNGYSYYDDAPRTFYNDRYSYGSRGGRAHYGGSGYGYSYGGGYASAQSGGVVVIIEEQRGQRYVPVIREEIIEEYYEVEECEVIRERVITRVPQPRPRPDKRIKYIKQR
ncbi:hypothetical protein AAG612_10665 [Citromicrobium bathyomarinum]|uniref:hypothetical protein n=1 Tax=Citromicrobium bathyomarinum TaxID=72174 RepID=UPI00315B145C